MARKLPVALGIAVVIVAGLVGGVVLPSGNHSSSRFDECTSWAEGQTCHDFRLVYTGYGTASVAANGAFVLSPAPASDPAQTHAALAVRDLPSGNTDVSATVQTVRRLRRPQPNPWEVAWLLWNYTDDSHFYSLVLKPNGWEVGKEDPAYPGRQRFLATGDSPVFPVGGTYRVRIRQTGASIHIELPGLTIRCRDNVLPYTSGGFGLYTEDSVVQFTRVQVAD